jgi:hypothetical protein
MLCVYFGIEHCDGFASNICVLVVQTLKKLMRTERNWREELMADDESCKAQSYLASNLTCLSAKPQMDGMSRAIQLNNQHPPTHLNKILTSMRTWFVHNPMSTFLTSDTLGSLHGSLGSAI